MGKSAGAKNVNQGLMDQNQNLHDQQGRLLGADNPFDSLLGKQNSYLDKQMDHSDNLYNTMLNGYNGAQSDDKNLFGNGVFDELSKTGGFNDADKSNYMRQATAVIPSFFSGMRDRLSNQNKVNHGLNPGYNAQNSKLTRDAAQAGQSAELGAQNSLHDMIMKGRTTGAQGLQQGAQAKNQFALGKAGLGTQMYGLGQSGVNSGISNLLQALGMKENDIATILGLENQNLGQQGERNPNTSMWEKLLGPILGAGGSILGGLAGR